MSSIKEFVSYFTSWLTGHCDLELDSNIEFEIIRSLNEASESFEKERLIYKFVIPLTPITKKNGQRILKNPKTGRLFIAPSSQYKKYEKQCLYLIEKMNIDFEPINYRVNAKCLFFMPTHRVVDLTNLEEAIDDIMTKGTIIDDDNCRVIASHDGSRVYYDKEFPRTEIYIEEYIEEGGYDYV